VTLTGTVAPAAVPAAHAAINAAPNNQNDQGD
jgi:hypothetical protein